jgi:multidrug resistance efflux pump
MVVPSQALFTLISTEEWFAVANFRETDLQARVRYEIGAYLRVNNARG